MHGGRAGGVHELEPRVVTHEHLGSRERRRDAQLALREADRHPRARGVLFGEEEDHVLAEEERRHAGDEHSAPVGQHAAGHPHGAPRRVSAEPRAVHVDLELGHDAPTRRRQRALRDDAPLEHALRAFDERRDIHAQRGARIDGLRVAAPARIREDQGRAGRGRESESSKHGKPVGVGTASRPAHARATATKIVPRSGDA